VKWQKIVEKGVFLSESGFAGLENEQDWKGERAKARKGERKR
jgi:hypothetical protein